MATIKSIRLQNFKGVKSAEYNFDGKTVTIKGQNGAGKTTIADAFFWVVADKNYSLASNPNIRPIGAEEVAPRVDIVFDVDWKEVTVAKIQKCTVKKSKTGGADTVSLSNSYEVNSVEYGERDFKKKMQEYGFDFGLFLPLSHPDVFTGQKADEMRKVLFGMASEKTDYEIACDIKGAQRVALLLERYTAEEIKAMQNATLRKIREEYGKDGEILRAKIEGMEQTKTDIDVAELELLKNSLNEQIAENKAKQEDISKQLEEYDNLSSGVLDLQFKLSDLERKAKEKSQKELIELQSKIGEKVSELQDIERAIGRIELEIEGYQSDIESGEKERERLLEQFDKVNSEVFDENTAICPTCHRELPQEEREKLLITFEKSKDERITEIKKDGFGVRQDIDNAKEMLPKMQEKRKDIVVKKEEIKKEIADLKRQLSALPQSIDISDREDVRSIKQQIADKEQAMQNCNSAEDIRQNLRDELNDLQNQLVEVEKKFALAKKNMEIDDSIAELRQKQGEYEQSRANSERILDQLKEVNRKKNEMLTDAVNSHFKLVKFRLFNYLKNGEVVDDCEPMIDGKSLKEQSNGALKVLAKLDIVKGLQRYYQKFYPVFVDDFSLVTENTECRIDMDCQLIKLVAERGIKKLEIVSE